MRGPRAQARPISTRARRATTNRTGVTIAVYHASEDVERHLTSLRRTKRFTLACFPQHSGPLDVPATGFDGVLWELRRRSRPDLRRLGPLARRLPVVWYSAESAQELRALSRRAGFCGHLTAPIDPAAVTRHLAAGGRGSLPGRMRAFVRALSSASRRAEVLEAVLRATTTTRVPERMAASVAELAATWFGGDGWAVLEPREGRTARWLADRGVDASWREGLAEVGDQVVRTGQIVWQRGDGGAPGDGADTLVVGLPLRARGRTVGVLVGGQRGSLGGAQTWRELTSHDHLAPVLTVTEACAGSLDVALRLKRANMLATIDDLTGLSNSRSLNEVLRREVKRAARARRPLALLFVDLDGFKGINDRYGHLCGSRAIVEAAQRIQAGARETDVVARFGGDEFAVILPDTGPDGALVAARRVRERVAAEPFLASEGISYRLTASVGVATMPEVAATPEGLLVAADTAMYRVKSHGKDGIEMAPWTRRNDEA